MSMDVIVAPGDEDFHSMIVTRTYRRDGTLNATDDDDGANPAHITAATPSHRQHNPTSGILTATLRTSFGRTGRNSNDNDGPRQQTKLARTSGSALILSAEILASIEAARSQASPKLHHVVVNPYDYCYHCAPAAGILIAQRRCRNIKEASIIDHDFGERRGSVLSKIMPLANGRSLNLEVERSKLICPPRPPAIMITNVQEHPGVLQLVA